MKIWRIQHKETRLGPYQHRDKLGSCPFWGHPDINLWYGNRHPGPYFGPRNDLNFNMKPEYRFGFPTLRALVRWFNKLERAVIFTQGFEIVSFDVPDDKVIFTQDREQVIFPMEYVPGCPTT